MKRTRKLLAMLMALAMALSCCVTALAEGTGSGDSVGSGDTIISGDGFTSERHEVISEVKMESKRPEDVIRLVLPTVTVDNENKGDTFDLILDPHNLIQESVAGKAARLPGDFATGTLVYFKTKDAEGDAKAQYTADSKELKIINKSNIPVAVKLEANVQRPDGENDYAFGAETFKLRNEPAEATPFSTTAPEMVLSLKGGSETKYITTPTAVKEPGFALTDTAELVKSVTVEYASGLGADYKQSINDVIQGATLTLTPTPATNAKASDNLDKVVATFAGGNSNTTIGLKANTGTANAEQWDTDATKEKPLDTDTFTLTATLSSVSLLNTMTTDDDTDTLTNADVATVTVVLNTKAVEDALAETTPPTAEILFDKWGLAVDETAKIDTALDYLYGSYTTQYDQDGTAYAYVLDETLANDKFDSVSFKLNAKINGGDVWDDLFDTTSGNIMNINVVWDVVPFVKGVDTLPDKAPSASVAQAANGTGTIVLISYNLGRGSLAATKVSKVTYLASNRDTNITAETASCVVPTETNPQGTWAFKASSAINTAGKVKVTFDDTAATVVELSIK